MKIYFSIFSTRKLQRKFLAVLALAVVFSIGGLGVQAFSGLGVRQASAERIKDCSENSVISCGVGSSTELIDAIKANKPGDLKTIYAKFGLSSSEYDAFAEDAKTGVAKTNGDVVVDGKVVSRDAWSIGRSEKSYSDPYKIGNKTYHKSMATEVLGQDLPVLVWFDGDGKPAMIVIMACGNPMGGKPVTPTYTCKQLKSQQVKDEENTYRFTTDAPLTGAAKLSKVVYHFDDGSIDETRTSATEAVEHTFKPGTHNVKVTVYVKLPNGKEVPVNGSGCVKKITIAAPKPPKKAAWQCKELTAMKAKADDDYSYAFQASTTMSNATLVSADFDFGDGTTQNDVKPAKATDSFVKVKHAYTTAGERTAKAVVTFKAKNTAEGSSDTTVSCTVTFTVKQPPKSTPKPTPTPPQVLGTSTAKVAEVLPAAGPAGLVGMFAGAATVGTLGYRWNTRRRIAKIDNLVDRLRR